MERNTELEAEWKAEEQTKLYDDYVIYTVILISNIISILLMNKYIMFSNGIFTTALILKINDADIRSTLIPISILLIPLMIGLTSTSNKVEGIIKGIVGSLIVSLPFYFFKLIVIILEWGSNKNTGLQGFGTFVLSSIYTLVAYIYVIIMMLKTTN
jgi:hypothetical protein